MSVHDTARIFYTSARSELIERIRLRDGVFVFYLASVAALLGVALGTASKTEVLLIIPFLGLGTAILISQHFAVIGALASYCVLELEPFLKNQSPSEFAPQWDHSKALRDYRDSAISLRTWGHSILIVLPSIIGLYLNWEHGFKSPFPLGIVWWFGLISLGFSIFVMLRVHYYRVKIYETFPWTQE